MDVTPPEHVMCPKEHHECLQMSYKIPHYSTLMCIAIETICQLTKYDHICAIKRNRVYKSTRNLGSYRGLLLAVESFISDVLVLMLFKHVQTYMTL